MSETPIHLRPVDPAAHAGPEPFDLSQASVAHMLEADPPARDWLVKNRLPLGVVGLLAAAGKTGKSMAVLQLAVSATSGLPWLGMEIDHTGSVLILSAEDDRNEVWRRLRAIQRQLQADGEWTEAAEELIAERLHVLDRVGSDNLLTRRVERELIRTPMADRVIATANELPGPVLIVLDPLARFDGGEPNASDDATRVIETAEHIRKHTGATVLLPHHTRKAAALDEDAGQEAVRGASGLVDGARWIGLMQKLRKADAKRYGLQEEDAPRYVRFTTPAANYCEPWDGMWLERLDGGVLAPTELHEHHAEAKQQRADERYDRVVTATKALLRRHGPMSARHIRDTYGGQEGVMGAGQRAVWTSLRRAVEEGELLERPRDTRGGGHDLHLKPGDE
ncbi:helicase RepA family protein [Aquisalimonas asiatica]|uniref:RecA-family ATPase n=1 Tax=Aquisalimonas asiatica TaxID=406100 RepID=A0A1H8TPE7_9GAMM|nr:helicase RepA family protein [Aquisalimonas asiatica]SEO92494.1 RecA-family ATPase [Aquisalimonas asiatica]